ncbi:hypothetical protein [Leptolyngbya iicbica]
MTRVSPLPRLIPMSVQRRWFEKVMAAIALLNLGLVVFDLSYIPLRNVYRTIAPNVTEWYGQQFKGITPHPFTVDYLEKVSELETLVAEGGLVASSSERMLTELRTASDAMIAENPFDVANKSGTLERIKELMRRHVEATTGQPYESATEAFTDRRRNMYYFIGHNHSSSPPNQMNQTTILRERLQLWYLLHRCRKRFLLLEVSSLEAGRFQYLSTSEPQFFKCCKESKSGTGSDFSLASVETLSASWLFTINSCQLQYSLSTLCQRMCQLS